MRVCLFNLRLPRSLTALYCEEEELVSPSFGRRVAVEQGDLLVGPDAPQVATFDQEVCETW